MSAPPARPSPILPDSTLLLMSWLSESQCKICSNEWGGAPSSRACGCMCVCAFKILRDSTSEKTPKKKQNKTKRKGTFSWGGGEGIKKEKVAFKLKITYEDELSHPHARDITHHRPSTSAHTSTCFGMWRWEWNHAAPCPLGQFVDSFRLHEIIKCVCVCVIQNIIIKIKKIKRKGRPLGSSSGSTSSHQQLFTCFN